MRNNVCFEVIFYFNFLPFNKVLLTTFILCNTSVMKRKFKHHLKATKTEQRVRTLAYVCNFSLQPLIIKHYIQIYTVAILKNDKMNPLK